VRGRIRALLGDVAPGDLGITDAHDHLFLSSPALAGEELDDRGAAEHELCSFRQAGGGAVVQWTPRGLGRGLPSLARISARTGVHVVVATGRHRAALYAPGSSTTALAGDPLAAAFVQDILDRRCGLVKVGVGLSPRGGVEPVEGDALDAAAAAHRATGVPVGVHLEGGAGAHRVLERLEAGGVPAASVVLGHLGRNPDDRAIVAAARSGAWLCLDAPSPRHPDPEDRLGRIVAALVDEGRAGQLLLGADATTASSRSADPSCGPTSLLTGLVPKLRARLGDAVLDAILVTNPARAWGVAAVRA
jgi:predicted metal-dependent phosphotriesterase family hydrolase